MQLLARDWRILLFGAVVTVALPVSEASAKTEHHSGKTVAIHGPAPKSEYSWHAATRSVSTHVAGEFGHHFASGRNTHVTLGDAVYYHDASKDKLRKNGKARYAARGYGYSSSYSYGGLQCVPFARAASGIELKGNAANWWDAAAGIYQRGNEPEPGSVLNFRATGNMRLGHVAVVTAVIGSREIEIEHANWWGPGASKGGVSRGVPVVDVSPNNDWTEVRVGLGTPGDFGSTYPTYGFIYDRPDNGVMEARYRGSRGGEVAEFPRR